MARVEIERTEVRSNLETETNRFAAAENNLKQEIQSLNDQLNARVADMTALEARLTEMSAKHQVLTNDNTDLIEQMDELNVKLTSVSKTNEDLFKSFKELTREKELLVNEANKIKANHAKFESEAGKFINERNEQMKKLNDEFIKARNELKELNHLKQLEFDSMTNKFESNEFLLNQQIKELSEKCQLRYIFFSFYVLEFFKTFILCHFILSENLIKTYKYDLSLAEKEKSEMKRQLIEAEQAQERAKYESKAVYEQELDTYRKKYIEYELKFNEKLNETKQLEKALEDKNRKLNDREFVFTSMETKLTELSNENHKLNEVCKESSAEQIELQRKLCSVLIEKDSILKGKSFEICNNLRRILDIC